MENDLDTAVAAIESWDPALSVGNPDIDAEHQRLLRIIAKLKVIITDWERYGPQTAAVVTEIADYTVSHFSHEEELMRQYGFHVPDAAAQDGNNPQAISHLNQHRKFIKEFTDLTTRLSGGLAVDLVTVKGEYNRLHAWLVRHIKEKDQLLADFISQVQTHSKASPLSSFNRF